MSVNHTPADTYKRAEPACGIATVHSGFVTVARRGRCRRRQRFGSIGSIAATDAI